MAVDQGAAWPEWRPGASLQVVKHSPAGNEAARYPGTVVEAGAPPPWVAVRATWTYRRYDLDGLIFAPGDTLHEFFSPVHPFNVFSIFTPEVRLRGWYANVTYPTRLDTTTEPPTLIWHDLYVDVIALPDGKTVVRDEDELAASGLAERDPDLHAAILAARDELLTLRHAGAFPFHEQDLAQPSRTKSSRT